MSKQLSAEIHNQIEQESKVYGKESLWYIEGAVKYAKLFTEAQERIKELEAKMKWIKACIEQELDSQDIIDFITKALTPNNQNKEDADS